MAEVQLKAWPREERGTRAARRLRRQGLVPVVLYGRKQGNVLLVTREEDLESVLEEHSYVVELQWDGQSEHAQIKEMQIDELNECILHVDFARISMSERIQVEVPVEFDGDAPGASEGGVVEPQLRAIEVEALPNQIPESISVDISELGIGDSARVGDVDFPAGVNPLTDPSNVVVAVVAPTEVEEEEEEMPEDILAEPEVIGREEEEEEELLEGEEEAEAEAEEAAEE
jgi:large subunit ribosomal protein L25